ncbi:MAG: hypothetical protein I8H91_03435 [Burkholderiales bacterium]|nr:hypothetical protein [Burkholderiales bacterium]
MYFKLLFFPLFIGLISAQKINLFGEIFVGELLTISYMILRAGRLRLSTSEKKIVGFGFLWVCAQLFSDFYNQTIFLDAIKGVFTPVVFISTFIGLLNFLKSNFERFPSFVFGTLCGGLISLLLFPTEYFLDNFWKWGIGSAVIGLIYVYYSFFLQRKNLGLLFLLLIAFSVISLYFDGRSMAVFPLIAILCYKLFGANSSPVMAKQFSGKWVGLKLIIIVLPVLFFINLSASYLFSSASVLSHFSPASAAKYQTQANGTYGILLGGRSEILISGKAFLDKPWLGHGSWAKDRSGYLETYAVLKSQLGYSMMEGNEAEEFGSDLLIPAHSYLMGTLIWAGVLGGVFWLVLLNEIVSIFVKKMNLFPIYFYAGTIGFIWNVFFSPFGANARWSTSIFLAGIYSYVYYLKLKSNNKFYEN